jgi:hypothetical protein
MERIVAANSVVLSARFLLTRASADAFTVSAVLAWLALDFVAYRFVLWATSHDLGGAQLLVARLIVAFAKPLSSAIWSAIVPASSAEAGNLKVDQCRSVFAQQLDGRGYGCFGNGVSFAHARSITARKLSDCCHFASPDILHYA